MGKAIDTAAKRLNELFNSELHKKLLGRLKLLEKEMGTAAKTVLPDWAELMMAAPPLNPSSIFDRAVIKAFNKAGLSPKDPTHWRLLVTYFSFAHFGMWPARGRPVKWTTQRHSELLRDFAAIRNEKPDVSDIQVCRFLAKRHPDKYDKLTAGRLAKEVKRAQDPKVNPALALILDVMLRAAKFDHQEKNIAWTPDIEAKERREIIESASKRAGLRNKPKARARIAPGNNS